MNELENYCFSLRELRTLYTEHQPENFDQFFYLLELWARKQIREAERQEEYNRQQALKDAL